MDLTTDVYSDTADPVINHTSCSTEDDSDITESRQEPDSPIITQPDYSTFGQNFRIALACMDAAERFKHIRSECDSVNAYREEGGQNTKSLATQLQAISAEIDTHRAELLELLVQFDEQQGWAAVGARTCAAWANAHLGIAIVSAYEYLRVGRELRELPIIRALFRGGELSWSKVRLLVRVADGDNERQLTHASLDATVADVERICREFRWKKLEQHDDAVAEGDLAKQRSAEDLDADRQFRNRAVSWREQPDGSTEIRITLPPEKAQALFKSLEHCENELYEGQSNADLPGNADVNSDRPTPTQRRADALLLMAERSLNAAGATVSRADRYQVIMHVDKKDLMTDPANLRGDTTEKKHTQDSMHVQNNDNPSVPNSAPPATWRPPTRRSWIEGAGPIAQSVAKRITCDCSVVGMLLDDGEPLNIGRKTRIWPAAIARAVMTRDRHCQYAGCNEHRHLEIHHIKHWSEGGETSVENGICLCHRHHALVHEGGYRIERAQGLRSRAKLLLPTRHRFKFAKPSIPEPF